MKTSGDHIYVGNTLKTDAHVIRGDKMRIYKLSQASFLRISRISGCRTGGYHNLIVHRWNMK
jgi:hypothetical protein